MNDGNHRDVLIAFDSEPGMFPQLYIGVKRLADLERFITLVEGLASGEHSSVEVADPKWAYLENVASVRMEALEAGTGAIDIERSAHGAICRWTNEKAEWEFTGDLLKVLREGRPGFPVLATRGEQRRDRVRQRWTFRRILGSPDLNQ